MIIKTETMMLRH